MAENTPRADANDAQTSVREWSTLQADMAEAQSIYDRLEAEKVAPLWKAFKDRWPRWPTLDKADLAAANAWKEVSGLDEACREFEAVADRMSDLSEALLKLPSPDHRALLWKLDRILEVDASDGFTVSWRGDLITQTVIDCRRLLGSSD